MDEGEAVLHIENVCRVFDAFTVPNSLNPLHPLGLVSAFLKSLRIQWKGITNMRSFNNGSTFDRGGHFAAMDVPDLLIGDIREFFQRFR